MIFNFPDEKKNCGKKCRKYFKEVQHKLLNKKSIPVSKAGMLNMLYHICLCTYFASMQISNSFITNKIITNKVVTSWKNRFLFLGTFFKMVDIIVQTSALFALYRLSHNKITHVYDVAKLA